MRKIHTIVLFSNNNPNIYMCICIMTNQIFRQIIPKEELFKMLDLICHKNEKHYIINNSSYKRGIFKGAIVQFIEYCKPYYHTSKQHYLNRKLNYQTRCYSSFYNSRKKWSSNTHNILCHMSNFHILVVMYM